MRYEVEMPDVFTANVKKQALKYDMPEDLPAASVRKIFEYGLQQLLNDAAAGAKNADEAVGLADKRWDNLCKGILRASRVGVAGDPVAKEAMRIAIGKVKTAKAYIAWLQENGLKPADKAAVAKLADLAKGVAERDDIIAQAEANVAAVADIEIELEV